MSQKERTATESLNIALAGVESGVTIALTFAENEECKKALATAQKYLEQVRQHLVTIQFHRNQI
jgi:hypothetical protein